VDLLAFKYGVWSVFMLRPPQFFKLAQFCMEQDCKNCPSRFALGRSEGAHVKP
jgi:hypothetical protein